MGRVGKTAQRNISENYRYLISGSGAITSIFGERSLDCIDQAGGKECFYFGDDWQEDYQSYIVVLSHEMMIFLKELITYKFGATEIDRGAWYYFVWSIKKPIGETFGVRYKALKSFDSSIREDSKRFWRTTKLMVDNLKKGEE